MKLFKFLIPAAFIFLFAFTAHAQTSGAQEVIKTLLEQVLRIQTQLVAQVDYSTNADFTVVDITRSPSGSVTPGQRMTFTAVVENIGGNYGGGAEYSYTRFCIDNSDCLNSRTGELTNGDGILAIIYQHLSPRSGQLATSWTAVAGSHTLYVCAETRKEVTELNERNNCSSISFTVGSSSTQTNTTTTNTNTQTQTTNTSTQTNTTATEPTTTNSTNSDGEECTTTTYYSSRGSTTSTTCTDSGTTNNTNTSSVSPTDLSIINLARVTSGTLTEGQYITFSGSVRNLGGTASSISTVRFCLDNANCLNSTTGRVGSDQGLGSVPANSVSNPLAATLSTSAGSHVLYMCADVGKVVAEGSESNNCSAVSFSVSAPSTGTQTNTNTNTQTNTNTNTNTQTQTQTQTQTTGTPDLAAQSLTRSPSGTIREGNTVTLSAVVQNRGSATAASSKARFCTDSSNCSSGRIDADQSVSSLSAGASQTVSVSWTPRQGSNIVYFCADVEQRVSEATEVNNCLWTMVYVEEAYTNTQTQTNTNTNTNTQTNTQTQTQTDTVTTGTHDLVAANISRIGSSGTIRAGDFVTFMGYIRNIGTVEAPDSWARFCVDNTDCLNNATGRLNPGHRVSETGSPLPAGGSSAVSRTWTAEAGRHTIYLCANTGTPPIAENNKNNNCAQITVDVEAAVYIPPVQSNSVIEIGMTTPFYWEQSGVFANSNNDAARLNYNRYISNLDRLKGKVDWVRIHAWSWLILSPSQFNIDGTPKNETTIISNPTFYIEGIRTIKLAIDEAHKRGFKVQIASADVDHRVSEFKRSGQYVYNIDQLRTHYEKVMARMAAEFRSAESWVLFNESNQFNYRTGDWQGANDNNVIDHVPNYLSDVASLLGVARTEIKKTNPNTIIISSNFAPWELYGNTFLSQQNQRRLKLYYDAVMPYVDMVSFNWYVSDQGHLGDTSKMDFELGQMEKHVNFIRANYSKPIFIGEFGIPVCRGATDAQQVAWFNAALRKMQALGIPKIMLYTMQDDSQFGLGSNDCEYNFGFINQYAQQRPAYNSILGDTVQDVRRGAVPDGGTAVQVDQHVGTGTSSYYCQATIDASRGVQAGNNPVQMVGSKAQCIDFCAGAIRSEDQSHWKNDGWNMCWFDTGFVRPDANTSRVETPRAEERYFCQASIDSTLGPAAGNNPIRSVASREQCLDFCSSTIRSEDLDNWRTSGYNMCWFDKGFISANGSSQNFVMLPSVVEALANMKWSSHFIGGLLENR